MERSAAVHKLCYRGGQSMVNPLLLMLAVMALLPLLFVLDTILEVRAWLMKKSRITG